MDCGKYTGLRSETNKILVQNIFYFFYRCKSLFQTLLQYRQIEVLYFDKFIIGSVDWKLGKSNKGEMAPWPLGDVFGLHFICHFLWVVTKMLSKISAEKRAYFNILSSKRSLVSSFCLFFKLNKVVGTMIKSRGKR